MPLISWYYAQFIAGALVLISLILILAYLLFYNEEDEDLEEEMEI